MADRLQARLKYCQVLLPRSCLLTSRKHLWEAWCEEDFFVDFLCHDPAFLDMPVSPTLVLTC